MSKQQVEVKPLDDPANKSLFLKINADVAKIRENAYYRSQRHSGQDLLDDWLRAEQELFEVPASTLADTERSYTLKLALPGIQGSQLTVAADPHSITVHANTQDDGDHRQLFRRFEFAAEVDVEHIKANLQNGVLDILMPKVGAPRPKSAGHAA